MLYVITGPAGVGKSTISEKIADSLSKSCLIEGDEVYHFVRGGYVSPWLEGNHLPLFWDNAISLISNGLEKGYDVVFNYIVAPKDIQRIKESFPGTKIKFIVLLVDEKTIVERDKLRPLDCQMGERSLILLNNMKKHNFSKKYILDTSNLTINETYDEILKNDRFFLD